MARAAVVEREAGPEHRRPAEMAVRTPIDPLSTEADRAVGHGVGHRAQRQGDHIGQVRAEGAAQHDEQHDVGHRADDPDPGEPPE